MRVTCHAVARGPRIEFGDDVYCVDTNRGQPLVIERERGPRCRCSIDGIGAIENKVVESSK